MRDFFYNKSDVLITVLIIAIAMFVIYLRVGVIMDYSVSEGEGDGLLPIPDIGAMINGGEDDADTTQNDSGVQDSPAAPADGANSDAAQDGAEGADAVPADGAQGGEETTPPADTDTTPEGTPEDTQESTPPDTGAAAEVSITVAAGDSWSTAADKMVTAKLITDKTAFLNKVVEMKADSKLQQRTFTIPAGSTPEQIINIMIK